MGCCLSKGEEPLVIDIPGQVGITDEWVLRPKDFLDECKLLPYTAACPSSFPYQCLTRVVLGDGHLFAALWEGKGGSQAARHCVSTCYDEVLSCIRAGDDPSTALSKACQHMDEAYLNSPDLPDLVKAGVGATGTMLFLDTQSNRCHIARLGKSMPFATARKGSFNNVAVEVKDLVPFSINTRAKSSSNAASSAAEPQQQQQQQQQWDPATSGVTHAIGIGCGKRDNLRKLWQQNQQHQQQQARGDAGDGQTSGGGGGRGRGSKPPRVPHISPACEVYVSQLATSDENLVIAAEGLLAVSPPKEIATLLQHFNAGNLSETKRAFCGIKEQQLEILRQQQDAGEGQQAGGIGGGGGAAGRGGKATNRKTTDTSAVEEQQSQLVEMSRPTNVASIVMHQAQAKSLSRFNQQFSRQQEQKQESAAAAAAGGATTGQGSRQQRKSQQGGARGAAAYEVSEEGAPSELTQEELTCLPLSVDLSAFTTDGKGQGQQSGSRVVQLPDSYPVGGLSKADVHGDMGVIVIALNWPKPPDALRSAAAAVTPLRPGPRALTRNPRAEWHWQLLRLHVKAMTAYRRELRKAWHKLLVDMQAAAESAARQAEVHAWKTKGAAVKVNLSGAVVDPETPVNFLRAHHPPPSGSSSRQPHYHHRSTPPSSSRPAAGSSSIAGGARLVGSSSSNGGGIGGGSSSYLRGGSSSEMEVGHGVQLGSLPDVAARSQKSSGGTRRGAGGAAGSAGVVAAAVAAINSRSPPKEQQGGDSSSSPSPVLGSSSSRSRRMGAAGLSVQQPVYNSSYGGDTTADLDSPTKSVDSPKRYYYAAGGSSASGGGGGGFTTPAGAKFASRGGGGLAFGADVGGGPWGYGSPHAVHMPVSPAGSAGGGGRTPGSVSSTPAAAGGSSSTSAHKNLSLRSNRAARAAASVSPAGAALTPESSATRLRGGGQSSGGGGGVYGVGGSSPAGGVTGRRPTGGSAVGGGVRVGSSVPGGIAVSSGGRETYDLRRTARKPASRNY